MMNKKFGETIKSARLAKGLSLRELARRLDISHPYLSQLENGKNDTPSILILKKLAKNLNVPFFYLGLLSSTDLGLKADELEKAKDAVRLYPEALSTHDFISKLNSFEIFKSWLTGEVFYDRGNISWSDGYLKELYKTFKLLEDTEKSFMTTDEVSLIDAFTKGYRPQYTRNETLGELKGLNSYTFPNQDIFFHLKEEASLYYKGIALTQEDKNSIKSLIENYLIRKLSAEEEVDRDSIKALLDEDYEFPHEKE